MNKQIIASLTVLLSLFLIAILTSNLDVNTLVFFLSVASVWCITLMLIVYRMIKLKEVEKRINRLNEVEK